MFKIINAKYHRTQYLHEISEIRLDELVCFPLNVGYSLKKANNKNIEDHEIIPHERHNDKNSRYPDIEMPLTRRWLMQPPAVESRQPQGCAIKYTLRIPERNEPVVTKE